MRPLARRRRQFIPLAPARAPPPPRPLSARCSAPRKKTISALEAAKRGYVVIRGAAYDGASYLASGRHPGGSVLASYCSGADATDVYEAFHGGSERSRVVLQSLYVADVQPEEPPARVGAARGSGGGGFEADVRALGEELRAEGLFASSPAYYALLVARTFALAVVAVVLTFAGRGSALVQALAAIVLAAFWQQSGWLAHDFAHNQVRRGGDGNGEAARRQGSLPTCLPRGRRRLFVTSSLPVPPPPLAGLFLSPAQRMAEPHLWQRLARLLAPVVEGQAQYAPRDPQPRARE